MLIKFSHCFLQVALNDYNRLEENHKIATQQICFFFLTRVKKSFVVANILYDNFTVHQIQFYSLLFCSVLNIFFCTATEEAYRLNERFHWRLSVRPFFEGQIWVVELPNYTFRFRLIFLALYAGEKRVFVGFFFHFTIIGNVF